MDHREPHPRISGCAAAATRSARLLRLVAVACVLTTTGLWSLPARADEWILSLNRREAERRKERWSLSNHLAAKGASSRQDLLYQFFLGQRSPQPRLELTARGLGQTVRERVDAADVSDTAVMGTAVGYDLRLAFNNFVSGLTGWTTPNIVPNFSAEVLEVDVSESRSAFVRGARTTAPSLAMAAGVRLFGSNPSDTAVYIDYSHRRVRSVQSVVAAGGDEPVAGSGLGLRLESVDTWLVQASAQIYLFPVLALSGGMTLDEDVVAGHAPDPRFRWYEHSYGGHLDLAMFRLSYSYGERTLVPRDRTQYPDAARVKTVTHTVGCGVVF